MSQMENDYHVHITARPNAFHLGLRELWAYRDLVWLFTQRNFMLIYKQTVLGPLWLIIRPIVTSVIYTIIFGGIAGLDTAGVPKILFYLSSHALWSFFAGCLNSNASVFISNASVFRKVYFPRLTVSASAVLSGAIQFFIQIILVVALMIGYRLQGQAVHPRWAYLPLLIPVLFVTGMMGLGLGILVSSVTTKYRDLSFLVGFGLQLWMYMSPVVYPVSQLPLSGLYRFILYNPMTAPMELFRLALLGTGTVTAASVISSLVFSALAVVAGILVFNKVERTFVDTV